MKTNAVSQLAGVTVHKSAVKTAAYTKISHPILLGEPCSQLTVVEENMRGKR